MFLGEKWEKRKVASVLLACGGVIIVAYGGAEHRKRPKEADPIYGHPPSNNATIVAESSIFSTLSGRGDQPSFSNPVLGDLLAFIGAVTMAAYEMAFHLIGKLPDEAKQAERYDTVKASRRRSRAFSRGGGDGYRSLSNQEDSEEQGLLEQGGEQQQSQGKAGGEAKEIGRDEQHQVIGDDEDQNRDWSGMGESQAIWNKTSSSEDPLSYQSISPPEQEDQKQSESTSTLISTDFKDVQDLSKPKKQARMNSSNLVREEEEDTSSETESDFSAAEAEVIERGLTRLNSSKSSNSLGKEQGRMKAAELEATLEEAEEEEPNGQPIVRRRERSASDSAWIPPPLPFGLHANIMTSGIGFVTFTCLWIGIVS